MARVRNIPITVFVIFCYTLKAEETILEAKTFTAFVVVLTETGLSRFSLSAEFNTCFQGSAWQGRGPNRLFYYIF